MKEISEKLAFEIYAMIKDAEKRSDQAYAAAKRGDSKTAEQKALVASVKLFEIKTHLEWHMEGYQHCEAQSAPLDTDND